MIQINKLEHRWSLRLDEPERITLQEAIHHHPLPHVRERCAALLKIADGHSPHWVAQQGLYQPRDPDSVYQWLTWYQQEGLAALIHHRHGGAHRRRL